MDQIPARNIQNDEAYFASSVALFKPKTYITDKVIQSVDYHFFLLTSPPPDIKVNGIRKELERGKIFAINPGDSVLCENAPKTKPFISLLIKPELIKYISDELGISVDIKFLKFQNPFSNELIHKIDSFIKESNRKDSIGLMMDCIGTQIAVQLLREFKTNIKKHSGLSPDTDDYVNLAMEFMQVFFTANITINDICDEIHVSPYHFIRCFKKKTGISPHQYLMNVRIKKAEELLIGRQHSVSEVAKICGFVSFPHFSNTFKIINGHSPSEYKKLFF
jgi:AraC-like DNA-binding protein